MADNEKNYLETRAEAELALAQASAHPAAVRAHYLLAGLYLDRIHSGPADNLVEANVALISAN